MEELNHSGEFESLYAKVGAAIYLIATGNFKEKLLQLIKVKRAAGQLAKMYCMQTKLGRQVFRRGIKSVQVLLPQEDLSSSGVQ